MYAVIRTGGKQYKVSEGDVIDIEKLDGDVGDKVEFEVLFVCDGSKIMIEPEAVAEAKVTGEIVEHFKGAKQIIFKFKKRKNYKRTKGHRQNLTKVRISSIQAFGRSEKKAESEVEEPAAETAAEVSEPASEETAAE